MSIITTEINWPEGKPQENARGRNGWMKLVALDLQVYEELSGNGASTTAMLSVHNTRGLSDSIMIKLPLSEFVRFCQAVVDEHGGNDDI